MSNPLYVSISRDELAVVIAGGCLGQRPPPGLDPSAALAMMPEDVAAEFRRAADAVATYLAQQFNDGGMPTDLVHVTAEGRA